MRQNHYRVLWELELSASSCAAAAKEAAEQFLDHRYFIVENVPKTTQTFVDLRDEQKPWSKVIRAKKH